MLGQIPDPGSGKVPVIFPARPLADSFTATARLSPLHVYTSHTRPLYTSLPTRQNIEAVAKANVILDSGVTQIDSQFFCPILDWH